MSCEHGTSRVVRERRDGKLNRARGAVAGQGLNSPNDIVIKSTARFYFIDPSYGRTREDVGILRPLPLDFRGVYRIAPDGSGLKLLCPTSISERTVLSLDEKELYINHTPRLHIRVFDVESDGTIANGRVFGETDRQGEGRPDGMKIDCEGHVYCTGPGGITSPLTTGAALALS